MLTLVLGGARSGKSRHGEALARQAGGELVFIATAEPLDREMRDRIAAHRRRRAGQGWRTVEAPHELAETVRREAAPGRALLVDCLTLWLSNRMLAGADPAAETGGLAAACAGAAGELILVSNEVGSGIVPDNALARAFRDHAGALHQRLARQADRVVLMVAGIPMTIKPAPGPA